ncbi:MAG: methyltransferase domain-containing protein [Candidatus Omnitrophica bacterium]|nr:methyltransferase domain-containing protein [Candidatus Omnitrophota bacterium]
MQDLHDRAKVEIQARYDRMAKAELTGAGSFEPVGRAKHYFRARKLQAALALGSFPAGGRLLEIGCSVGQFSFPLARLGYQVCGMDLSSNSVEVATQRAQAQELTGLTFVVGDAELLSRFPTDGFDGIVSFSTLRYVNNLSNALVEVYRVLKPGARAVIDFPNRWCPWFYLKPWLGSEPHPHDHWFSEGALRKLFAQAGFRDVQVRHLLFTPTVAPDRALRVFQGMDWIGERLPLVRRLAGIIMVGARKP